MDSLQRIKKTLKFSTGKPELQMRRYACVAQKSPARMCATTVNSDSQPPIFLSLALVVATLAFGVIYFFFSRSTQEYALSFLVALLSAVGIILYASRMHVIRNK